MSSDVVTSRKRKMEDIFSTDTETDNEPKKKRSSKFGVEDLEADKSGSSDVQDIQELLATTKKQIEERKKQTQMLLAKQGLPPPAPPPAALPSQQSTGFQQPLLQHPPAAATVHPLAYSRELHMTRGMALGPSALDKAVKAAEVRFLCQYFV